MLKMANIYIKLKIALRSYQPCEWLPITNMNRIQLTDELEFVVGLLSMMTNNLSLFLCITKPTYSVRTHVP